MSEISLDPILTDAGLAALQNSDATGIAAKITHVALGDVGATPIPSVQALQNERLRVACFSGGVTGNRQITLTANVAAGTPEFFVKEIGFFLEDGTLFAFWSHPEQALGYRSQTTPWFFKFVLSWNVAGTVDVVFDTTAVLACISQDTAVLDAKIRHTIESENITPDDADETQLTDAIESKVDRAVNSLRSNCLLNMPQNINLELNSGVLTLKAGSKVYVPNGAEIFNEIVLENDLSSSLLWGQSTSNMLFYDSINNTLVSRENSGKGNSNIWSGSSPTIDKQYGIWYDTTNNILKSTTDTGAAWSGQYSLPIAIITTDVNRVPSSINQIFNGGGYVGSTVFVLPGIKVLIPDGRNADGTLNNTTNILSSVKILDVSDWMEINSNFSGYVVLHNDYLIFQPYDRFSEDYDISNTSSTRLYTYCREENKWYISNDGGVSWAFWQGVIYARMSLNGNGIIRLNPKQVFQAVSKSDTDWLARLGMPDYSAGIVLSGYNSVSNKFTAPCDGLIIMCGGGTANNAFNLVIDDEVYLFNNASTTHWVGQQFFIKKGSTFYYFGTLPEYGMRHFYPLEGAL